MVCLWSVWVCVCELCVFVGCVCEREVYVCVVCECVVVCLIV